MQEPAFCKVARYLLVIGDTLNGGMLFVSAKGGFMFFGSSRRILKVAGCWHG